jgi:tripartite-type tricarboxylate transporter receptor subunit TctC
MNCFFRWCCLCLLLVLGQTSVFAQAYPDRAIKIIVPFPPGGPVDTLARILSEQLGRNLKQTVIIENRPGAGGSIGAALAARAAPDGYTFLFTTPATHTQVTHMRKFVPYDPFNDFTPITILGTAPNVLVAHPAAPVAAQPPCCGRCASRY